jgi:hypothetical protein
MWALFSQIRVYSAEFFAVFRKPQQGVRARSASPRVGAHLGASERGLLVAGGGGAGTLGQAKQRTPKAGAASSAAAFAGRKGGPREGVDDDQQDERCAARADAGKVRSPPTRMPRAAQRRGRGGEAASGSRRGRYPSAPNTLMETRETLNRAKYRLRKVWGLARRVVPIDPATGRCLPAGVEVGRTRLQKRPCGVRQGTAVRCSDALAREAH